MRSARIQRKKTMGKKNDKYTVKNTKISASMSEVFDKICEVTGVDTYHLLQWFSYTIIRACAPMHELSPEIQKLMAMMESSSSWQNAFNLCNPDGLDISQLVLILEQKGKKGFGAVMIDKPFMGTASQTECVDDIVERVIEVCMPGVYRRLRRLAIDMDCEHLSDLLITMTDAQTILNLEAEDKAEMKGPGNYTEFGKVYEYGQKKKSVHRKTIDEKDTIKFKKSDEPDFRPFGQEW